MNVSRVAYDRFELQLPAAEPGRGSLSDERVAREVAGWLWEFGPTPLLAVVEHDGKVPAWLSRRLTLAIPWNGTTAAACLLEERPDLERFLVEGSPHDRTRLLWPRRSPAKTFEALCAGGEAWTEEVDGHARMADPHVVEVFQLQPA